GIEHIAQRNAARRQVGLVVADPNVVVRLRADHGDGHVALRGAEFVESPGRTEGRPQACEARAEHDDLTHPTDATRQMPWPISPFPSTPARREAGGEVPARPGVGPPRAAGE